MSYYPRCEIVIKKNPYALRFIENQTFDICKLAVKQNINTLQFVKSKKYIPLLLCLKLWCLL